MKFAISPQAALDDINAKKDITTIVVAHRLTTIRNADMIVAFEVCLLWFKLSLNLFFPRTVV